MKSFFNEYKDIGSILRNQNKKYVDVVEDQLMQNTIADKNENISKKDEEGDIEPVLYDSTATTNFYEEVLDETFDGDWLELDGRDPQHYHMYRLTGYGDYMSANRVNYEFGFMGPRSAADLHTDSSDLAG